MINKPLSFGSLNSKPYDGLQRCAYCSHERYLHKQDNGCGICECFHFQVVAE